MSEIPRQVTFRGISHSPILDADVSARVDGLKRFYDRIVRCHVLVDVPHRHRSNGSNQVHVRVEVSVPGGNPIVVSRDPSRHAHLKDLQEEVHHKGADVAETHHYAQVAIREAFDTTERRLQEFASAQKKGFDRTRAGAPLH